MHIEQEKPVGVYVVVGERRQRSQVLLPPGAKRSWSLGQVKRNLELLDRGIGFWRHNPPSLSSDRNYLWKNKLNLHDGRRRLDGFGSKHALN